MFPNVEYVKTLVNGLKEFINTKIKSVRKDVDTKVDSINGVIDSLPQPDWNQNDPKAKDYIKNRPCYTENEYKLVGSGVEGLYNAYQYAPDILYKVTIGENDYLDNLRIESSSGIAQYRVGSYIIALTYNSGSGMGISVVPETSDKILFFVPKEGKNLNGI